MLFGTWTMGLSFISRPLKKLRLELHFVLTCTFLHTRLTVASDPLAFTSQYLPLQVLCGYCDYLSRT